MKRRARKQRGEGAAGGVGGVNTSDHQGVTINHSPDADRPSARPQSGLSHLNHRSAGRRGAEEGRNFKSLDDAHVQARGLTSARHAGCPRRVTL